MYSIKFFKYFFLGGGPYGDFSDIIPSIRNRMDDFEIIFIAILLLREIAANLGWTVGLIPILIILSLLLTIKLF